MSVSPDEAHLPQPARAMHSLVAMASQWQRIAEERARTGFRWRK